MTRCYNGCWDSKTQQQFDREDRVLARIKEVEPEANVCYYPVEDECVVHVWGRPLSGHRSSRLDALLDAAQKLKLSTD